MNSALLRDNLIQSRLDALAIRPFRARFRLGEKERSIIEAKGMATVRQHAAQLLSTRLFPAFPYKDGKQTPYKGHPVFVAQHASATCCRTCLQNWHKIPRGTKLGPAEQKYVLDVIETWIIRNYKP
jgi:hypothetical protein